jgi:predicted transglutaminase-like cysteine proteinase
MRRRTFLAGGLVLLAGCSTVEPSENTPTQTPSETPTPIPTPTPSKPTVTVREVLAYTGEGDEVILLDATVENQPEGTLVSVEVNKEDYNDFDKDQSWNEDKEWIFLAQQSFDDKSVWEGSVTEIDGRQAILEEVMPVGDSNTGGFEVGDRVRFVIGGSEREVIHEYTVTGSITDPDTLQRRFEDSHRLSTLPDTKDDSQTVREFEWDFGNTTMTATITIPNRLYDYYSTRPRQYGVSGYGRYVSHTFDDREIQSVVTAIDDYGRNMSDSEKVNLAVTFVQSLRYTRDIDVPYNEYPKYPLETLYEEGGDCEDTSILLASLLREMGYDVRLLLFRDLQHMALGVAGAPSLPGTYYESDGTRFYYVETTGEGWKIGQAPDEYRNAQAELVPVEGYPILAHSWGMVMNPNTGKLRVSVNVLNGGSGAATNVGVRVEMLDAAGRTIESDTSIVPRVEAFPDNEKTTLLIDAPRPDQRVRFRVSLLQDGQVVDSTESELFPTESEYRQNQ